MQCDLLHIGLHKCGSTFLQKHGFASHPELLVLQSSGDAECRDAIRIMQTGSFVFSAEDTQQMFDRRAGNANGRKVVFSFEMFSGGMWTSLNSRVMAEWARDLFSPKRVLLILRSQYAYIGSAWCHYVREGGTMGLWQFLHAQSSPAMHRGCNIFTKLIYDQYVRMLQDVFGCDRLKVMLFEDFVSDYEHFMQELYEWLGVGTDHIPENKLIVPAGVKISWYQAQILRWINRLYLTPHHTPLFSSMSRPRGMPAWVKRWVPERPPPARDYVDAEQREAISCSNDRLCEMLGRDLAAVGYEVSL